MADTAQVRLKNTGKVEESVTVGGALLTVVPGGTLLVPVDHYATRVRNLVPIENIPPAPSVTREKELSLEVQQLRAALAELQAAKDKQADEAEQTEEREYPWFDSSQHGFVLSNGEVLRPGTSRADAEQLEAALHAAE